VAVAVTVAAPPVTVIVEPVSAVIDSVTVPALDGDPGVETVGDTGPVESWTTADAVALDTLLAGSVAVTDRLLVALAVKGTTTF
jgi:hypothetical protein